MEEYYLMGVEFSDYGLVSIVVIQNSSTSDFETAKKGKRIADKDHDNVLIVRHK